MIGRVIRADRLGAAQGVLTLAFACGGGALLTVSIPVRGRPACLSLRREESPDTAGRGLPVKAGARQGKPRSRRKGWSQKNKPPLRPSGGKG